MFTELVSTKSNECLWKLDCFIPNFQRLLDNMSYCVDKTQVYVKIIHIPDISLINSIQISWSNYYNTSLKRTNKH